NDEAQRIAANGALPYAGTLSRVQKGLRYALAQRPAYGNRLLPLPGNEVDFAAINEWHRRRSDPLTSTHEKVDVNAHCAMLFYHLAVVRLLAGAILALPVEFLVRNKMVGVSVIRVHVILGERHEQEDMRPTDDETNIPYGLIELQSKLWGYFFSRISLPKFRTGPGS